MSNRSSWRIQLMWETQTNKHVSLDIRHIHMYMQSKHIHTQGTLCGRHRQTNTYVQTLDTYTCTCRHIYTQGTLCGRHRQTDTYVQTLDIYTCTCRHIYTQGLKSNIIIVLMNMISLPIIWNDSYILCFVIQKQDL